MPSLLLSARPFKDALAVVREVTLMADRRTSFRGHGRSFCIRFVVSYWHVLSSINSNVQRLSRNRKPRLFDCFDCFQHFTGFERGRVGWPPGSDLAASFDTQLRQRAS